MHLYPSSSLPSHSILFSATSSSSYSSLSLICAIQPTNLRMSSSRKDISEAQINDLVSKLQRLIPQLQQSPSSHKVSAAKVLKETCNYIKKLHKEVDDLSDRLSELLAATDSDTAEAAILRSLLL